MTASASTLGDQPSSPSSVPGGQVLVDLKVASEAGNLVLLRRYPDRLEGRFTTRWASFMTMPHHNNQRPQHRESRAQHTRKRTTTTSPDPWYDNRVVWFLAQFHGLPADVRIGMELDPDTRRPTASLLSVPDGSWATVSLTTTDDRRYEVIEAGPTTLWEHVERAHQGWLRHDRPDWSRLGLTVTPDHQRLWLDSPEATSWPLRA